jgi:hypothetical protein
VSLPDRKVKTALDETRLLILGAQILLGFHLNAAFQPGFAKLGETPRLLYAGAFSAMAIGVGLLIAPSMQHLLVERGRSSRRILAATTRLAGWALLPMAVSLGADFAIVLGYRFGALVGGGAGTLVAVLALSLWYGGWLMRQPRAREGNGRFMEQPTSIDVRVEHMLTEARVLLPGAQALLGFQMAVLLTDSFSDLPAGSTALHAVALCCITLAIILLMAPAAFHRIAFGGQNSEGFYRLGSRFVIAAAAPLAVGIAGDFYVAVARALQSPILGAAMAAIIGTVLAMLWFVQPMLVRHALKGREE